MLAELIELIKKALTPLTLDSRKSILAAIGRLRVPISKEPIMGLLSGHQRRIQAQSIGEEAVAMGMSIITPSHSAKTPRYRTRSIADATHPLQVRDGDAVTCKFFQTVHNHAVPCLYEEACDGECLLLSRADS
ncbi:MAG TPA: hypothetical protein VFK07_00420 [Candidatus Paceibacterota bacterium]|nr:hypothetical protein [Candidatus Paceibacterota bacterium]